MSESCCVWVTIGRAKKAWYRLSCPPNTPDEVWQYDFKLRKLPYSIAYIHLGSDPRVKQRSVVALIRPENALRIVMAQRTLIEILLPELRAYATAISQSRDAAEDLVQDAVERGLRSDRRPELLEELRPWMFRVIRNLHYDELRKRRVRREYSAEEKRLSDEAGGPDTARDVLIRLAFEKLPPETREVLCLVDIMGLKYAEAAQVMGVPNGTVMSRISRARRALLDVVDGAGTAKQEVTRKT